jgi:hypothetical protein
MASRLACEEWHVEVCLAVEQTQFSVQNSAYEPPEPTLIYGLETWSLRMVLLSCW